MPYVDGKEFDYGKKGEGLAQQHAQRTGQPISYGNRNAKPASQRDMVISMMKNKKRTPSYG